MTAVRPYQEPDRARWDAYVSTAPGAHFAQRAAWRAVTQRGYGARPRWWLAERDGRVTGVLPLFEARGLTGERRLFSSPGGLLADDEATAAALLVPAREVVARERMALLELRDQRRRWDGLVTIDEHVTMELELPRDAETLWKAFDAKLRNQIRKGQKSGFAVRWGHDAPTFHRVLLENMRDLGTPILGPAYYRSVLEGYGDDASVLIVAAGDQPAGTMLVVEHAGVAADPWASSLRRFFALCPNQIVYWEAIQRAIARGMRRFDFGRSQRDSGTYRFKEQWLARPVPLYYQYVFGTAPGAPTLEDQKHAFALAVRLWQHLPVSVAGVLGRGVKRLFPEAL